MSKREHPRAEGLPHNPSYSVGRTEQNVLDYRLEKALAGGKNDSEKRQD
jgi:hypothetical protein